MLQSGQIPGQKPLQPPAPSNGQRKILFIAFTILYSEIEIVSLMVNVQYRMQIFENNTKKPHH